MDDNQSKPLKLNNSTAGSNYVTLYGYKFISCYEKGTNDHPKSDYN